MSGNLLLIVPIVLPILLGLSMVKLHDENQRNITVFIGLLAEMMIVYGLAFSSYTEVELWRLSERLVIAFAMDDLGAFFSCLIATVWFLAAVFSFEYMKHEDHVERFFVFYLTTLAALITVAYAKDFFTLYFGFEVMSLLSALLVIHVQSKEALSATLKYLGYSVFGAGLGLFGFAFLDHYCVTTNFVAGGALNMVNVAGNEQLLYFVYLLMMIGFATKAGMFPMHAWLPTAHPVAPSPASAVLSSLITKVGVFAIIRITYYMIGVDFLSGSWVQLILLGLAIWTIFMGSMLAYKEKLLKRRLAYSSVSQVSYVLFGVFLMSPFGMLGALLQMVYHAFAKTILFLVAGAIIYKLGITRVDQLKGVGKQMPIVMGCFTIASLSLIGIPPTGGFVSKWYLAQAGLSFGNFGLLGVAVLMISALLTAGYLLPIVTDAFFVGKNYDYSRLKKCEATWKMTFPLGVLAIGIVLLGIFPNPLMNTFIQIVTGIF